MHKKKPFKITGLDAALYRSNIPPDERAEAEAEIKKLFANFDPANPPGRPVVPVAPGTRVCLDCGGALKGDHVFAGLRFLNCVKCDAPFAEPVDA